MEEDNWKEFKEEKEARINLFSIRKQAVKRPNREGLKIFNALGTQYVHTYPRKCKTDSKKFKHLTELFNQNQVKEGLYIEFADVLNIQKRLIKKAIKQKMMKEIQW